MARKKRTIKPWEELLIWDEYEESLRVEMAVYDRPHCWDWFKCGRDCNCDELPF